MVAERNPEIRKAVNTLYELSADDKVRAEYEQRQKAWRDRKAVYEYMLDEALLKTHTEIAKRMKSRGYSLAEIAEVTGLSLEVVDSL